MCHIVVTSVTLLTQSAICSLTLMDSAASKFYTNGHQGPGAHNWPLTKTFVLMAPDEPEGGTLGQELLVLFYILKHFRSRAFEQIPKTNYVDIKEKSCYKKYDGDDDANCLGRGEVNSSVKTKFPREFGLQ